MVGNQVSLLLGRLGVTGFGSSVATGAVFANIVEKEMTRI
jgi:hypothetical protein